MFSWRPSAAHFPSSPRAPRGRTSHPTCSFRQPPLLVLPRQDLHHKIKLRSVVSGTNFAEPHYLLGDIIWTQTTEVVYNQVVVYIQWHILVVAL